MLTQAVHLARKDLRVYFRDKVGMALGFLLPIVLVTVFASFFGAMAGDEDGSGMPRLKLRVADLDQSEASGRLVAELVNTGMLEVETGDGKGTFTREAVFAGVQKGRFPLALVVGAGFARSLAEGGSLPLELIRDSAKTMEHQIVSQAILQGLMAAHGNRVGRAMALRGVRALVDETTGSSTVRKGAEVITGSLFDLLEKSWQEPGASRPGSRPSSDSRPGSRTGGGMQGPAAMLGIKDTPLGGERGGDRKGQRRLGMISQAVAGTAVMMLLFGLVAAGTTLLRERDSGTLRRLFLTPVPGAAILLGKFLFTFVIGLIQLAVMFAFGALVFGLPVLPHLPGLLVVSVALCAAATSFGVFIATVCRSERQVEGLSTLVILLMSAVGGSWFPLAFAPRWMQVAGHFTLNAWAMDGYQDLFWRGLPLVEVLPEAGVLSAIAVVLCGLAVVMFQRRFASANG